MKIIITSVIMAFTFMFMPTANAASMDTPPSPDVTTTTTVAPTPTYSYYCYTPSTTVISTLLKNITDLKMWIMRLLYKVEQKNIKIHELRLEIKHLKRQLK